VIDEELIQEGTPADVIAMFLGQAKYREQASMATDAFVMTMDYGSLTIEKEW
jgi:hypothetical protein